MLPSYDDPSPSLLDDVAPEIASGVLTASLWVLIAAIGVLVVVMIWAHVARVSRSRRIARVLEPLRPRLLALAADEESDDESLGKLGRYRERVVDRAVLDLLGKVRGGAATALVDILDRHGTVESALRGVHSWSATTRARSAQVLGATRRTEYSPVLAGMISDRDRAVRSTAVRDVREAVRRGLDDPDPGVRYVAATVASRGGMASLLPRVLQIFRTDRDERVRAAAARTLGVIGDARVIDDLGRALAPREPAAVRLAAATALGEIGAPAGVPLLRSVLAAGDRRLAEVAAGALASLGRTGREVLVETLRQGVLPPEISVRDTAATSPADLAALASLGAVTALGIRDRRPDLYEMAATARRATENDPERAPQQEDPAP